MDSKKLEAQTDTFSYGVKELRQAQRAQQLLSISSAKAQPKSDDRSFDPYNTSGSFDRKKNWTRVGKR